VSILTDWLLGSLERDIYWILGISMKRPCSASHAKGRAYVG
jgi:hypothetical protein